AFGFAQKADDLLVSKTFLHVQSPRGRELDSKLRRYSKLGGRRQRGECCAISQDEQGGGKRKRQDNDDQEIPKAFGGPVPACIMRGKHSIQ
ncbi:hypothetical protein, partial [Xanthomonas campestris]|uniref:hypothetical protein n=1 Tax=Xanthomonas campestris TaxID=339 RepID=UPI001C6E3D37